MTRMAPNDPAEPEFPSVISTGSHPRVHVPTKPTNPELRRLKATAQHLKPVVRVGKAGLTPAVLTSIETALAARELIKVRLEHDRGERDVLAARMAEGTGATLIMQVGKVAVFYRRGQQPAAAQ